MPAREWGWEVTPEEIRAWTLLETDEVLAINKPGLVVCHPSKRGPWSSLVGAVRECLGLARVHMPFRLDRETSGVVVFAKNPEAASRLQTAVQRRQVRKTYHAILTGTLREPVVVDQPLGRDPSSPVVVRQWVVPGGQQAVTEFVPLEHAGGHTLARVHPRTGRLHQIRVHAAWLGHAVVADKLYGPDPTLMLEFIAHGYTGRVAEMLPMPRQALHCAEVVFETERGEERFGAPVAGDMEGFWRSAN